MSKYYLLSPAKLKVKDAKGWLDLSKDDLLRTLDCLDGGQGHVLPLRGIDGTLAIYNSYEAASAAAIEASKEDLSCQHVLFLVKLSKQAKKDLEAAYAQHYKAGDESFYFRVRPTAITLVKASLSHVSKELPSFSIKDTNNLQQRLEKDKLSSSRLNKSLLLNSFVLLMLTFFTMGFIFAYTGVTAAIAASLIKMGLLQSGGLAMKLGISSTISLLLWDACFITLFAGHKLLKVGQTQFQRFQNRNRNAADVNHQLDLSSELAQRLNGFERISEHDEEASLSDVDLHSPPPLTHMYGSSASVAVTAGGPAPAANEDPGVFSRARAWWKMK